MGAFSNSYVFRVLLATPTRARNIDTVARQWRWLRTSLVDPYRSDLYNMRGPGPNGGRSTAAALVATTRAPKVSFDFGEPHGSEHALVNAHGADPECQYRLCLDWGQVVRAEIRDCRSLELQKRKRNPTVVSMLLRWRKPFASPPFTFDGHERRRRDPTSVQTANRQRRRSR